MFSRTTDKDLSPLAGIALACLGYSLFSMQDALVKWLVASYEVPQILFMRSIVITGFAAFMVWRQRHPSILRSPYRNSLVLRALLMFMAWLAFYSSARHLGLAEITTMYFCAPVMVVVLSIFVLKENVGMVRWLACIGGFVGVVLAANPTHAPNLVPAAMVLFAGFCWACSTILVRLVSRTESTMNQMMATSFFFIVACGLKLPWTWKTPDLTGWVLMIGLGLISAAGQFFLYEGFRYAPASTLAPIEYSGLVWAFLYGYIIWHEIPASNVFAGALLIVGSSLTIILWEHHRVSARRRVAG